LVPIFHDMKKKEFDFSTRGPSKIDHWCISCFTKSIAK
jgi:hypothetical protein